MSGKIFISYRRDDEPAEARSIHDRLAQVFGAEAIFMDVDNLVAGTHFGRELNSALNKCGAFIAIIGPRWQQLLEERRAEGVEDYVVTEISTALKRDDILVIPTLVRGARLPAPTELPASISDLAFRQAHTISHEKFSSDVSELATIVRKVDIGHRMPAPLRKLGLWAAAALVAVVLGSASYLTLEMRRAPEAVSIQVRVFTHDEGLTTVVAQEMRGELASTSSVKLLVNTHVDRRRPDAIYVSEAAPAELVRKVVNHVRSDVAYIFPVDYATKSSVEMQGISLAVGLMSNFEYYPENSAEKPYRITNTQLSWLLEQELDQGSFVDRLRYLAPSRKRPE